jgi:hypothetical protein
MSETTMIAMVSLASIAAGCFWAWLEHRSRERKAQFCPRCGCKLPEVRSLGADAGKPRHEVGGTVSLQLAAFR